MKADEEQLPLQCGMMGHVLMAGFVLSKHSVEKKVIRS